jgi:hypothetical protein
MRRAVLSPRLGVALTRHALLSEGLTSAPAQRLDPLGDLGGDFHMAADHVPYMGLIRDRKEPASLTEEMSSWSRKVVGSLVSRTSVASQASRTCRRSRRPPGCVWLAGEERDQLPVHRAAHVIHPRAPSGARAAI